MPTRTLTIDARFHGPPTSGNGGYAAGLLAEQLAGDVAVTLRRPPPLDVPLALEFDADGVRLLDGEQLVATALSTRVDLSPPPAPDPVAAGGAVAGYQGFVDHAFPTCFVCGPRRAAGDGLRIFPGPLPGGGGVAAPWIPAADLAGDAGVILPRFVWAALDCPGAFAHMSRPDPPLLVLGRLAVHRDRPVHAGHPYTVSGWSMGVQGRKYLAGTALYDAAGTPVAWGEAVWIALQPGG